MSKGEDFCGYALMLLVPQEIFRSMSLLYTFTWIPVGSMTAFPLTRPKSPILRDSSLPRAKKMFDGLRSR